MNSKKDFLDNINIMSILKGHDVIVPSKDTIVVSFKGERVFIGRNLIEIISVREGIEKAYTFQLSQRRNRPKVKLFYLNYVLEAINDYYR